MVGLEPPRDDFINRLSIVRVPNRGGGGGRGVLARFLRENRGLISALRQDNSAGESRNTRADDRYRIRHRQTVNESVLYWKVLRRTAAPAERLQPAWYLLS